MLTQFVHFHKKNKNKWYVTFKSKSCHRISVSCRQFKHSKQEYPFQSHYFKIKWAKKLGKHLKMIKMMKKILSWPNQFHLLSPKMGTTYRDHSGNMTLELNTEWKRRSEVTKNDRLCHKCQFYFSVYYIKLSDDTRANAPVGQKQKRKKVRKQRGCALTIAYSL